MTGVVELKPCPFCGGEPHLRDYDSRDIYVDCDDCSLVCSGDGYEGPDSAITRWNTRAPDETQAAQIAALTGERDALATTRDAARQNFLTMHGSAAVLLKRAGTAEAEVERLRKALEFYAEPGNWIDVTHWEGDPGMSTVGAVPMIQQEDGSTYCDCGDTARAALTKDNGNG